VEKNKWEELREYNEKKRGSIGEVGIEVRRYTYMLAELVLPY
jgi:hypothetical protein